ncbi:zinc-binding dehydrogenase [Paenibacillus dakarensis]|uniref:zinc-binding dehydrogenase n=1 Tax=Paenibacillus dakarensis TaxID=1527293 RepID=UPI0006D5376F|nr:zinc-binding dehydrogenase [Paenibacillus dakarensis]
MKALVLREQGNLNSLTIVHNRKIPIPKSNEIRVRVVAAGLNPSDHQIASYKGTGFAEEERVLGIDIAGIVDAVGSDVTNLVVGDRVYYLRSINNEHGGFAEYAVTTAHTVSKLPNDIPFAFAGVSPGAGFTAYQAIVQKLKLQAGRTILIHGGAGGVGGFAIQLAKLHNLTVYTTCQASDIPYVLSLGADLAIDYENQDVYAEINKLTNHLGVDYVLSTINPETATKDIDILRFGGEIVVTAGFPDFSRLHFYEKGLSLHEIALGAAHTVNDPQVQSNLAVIGDEFAKLISGQHIKPPAITSIKMEEIPAYLLKLKSGSIQGKVVAIINQ